MTELACVEGVVCGGCAQLEAGIDVDHVLDHDGLAGQEALQHLAAVLLAQAGDLRTGQHEVTLPHGNSYVIILVSSRNWDAHILSP